MNKFLAKNLPWKLFSLGLAFLMWLFVINTQNPLQPSEIKDVPVNIRGINEVEARGFVIQNEEELRNLKVRVSVKGKRLEIDKLHKNKSLIDVTLDLEPYLDTLNTDMDTIERMGAFEYNINMPGITVENIRPKTTYIVFEREKTITKTITPKITGGTNSEYMTLKPIIKPNSVELSGPKTKIESISEVRVEIDVDNFSEDALSYTAEVLALDQEGQIVEGIEKTPEFVQVTLPIGKKKKVPLEAQFKGSLPSGYTQSNTLISPEYVTIVGPAKKVDNIQSIKLEAINLDNMIQTGSISTALILPEGIENIDIIDNKAVVTVEIQKESTKEYVLPLKDSNIQVIGLHPDYEYEYLQEDVTIILSGTAEKLLNYDPSALVPILNLSNLLEGEYSVALQVAVPEYLKIVNKPLSVKVRIYPKPPVDIEGEGTESAAQDGDANQEDVDSEGSSSTESSISNKEN